MADIKTMTKYAIGVTALALIVLVGIAVTEGFSKSLRTSTTTEDVVVLTTLGAVNVSANIVSTYEFAESISSCVNSTGVATYASNYTFVAGTIATEGVSTLALTDGGVALVGDSLNCTIVWLADSDASDTGALFVTGLEVFGTFLAVLVLAIVGMIVVSLFRKKD